MAQQRFLNNFDTQFIAAVKSAPTSGTPATELDYGILRVSTGAAGALGTLTNGDWYILTGYKQSGSVQTNTEIMKVTAIDTSVINEVRLTVLRGQEGTTPQSYVSGDYLSMRETAGALGAMVQNTDPRLNDSRAPSGAAGGVLAGAYPNPGFAVDMATQAELDAAVASLNSAIGGVAATAAGKEPAIAGATGTPTAQYWRGDKGWRDFATDVRAAVLTGLVTTTNAAVAAADTVLVAIGKLQAQLANYVPLAGGVSMTGTLVVKALQETKVAMAANNIDVSAGNAFSKTISGATTLTVSNVPAAGTVAAFTLNLTNGGSATITWWSGVKWASGAAPLLSASGRDRLMFITEDGGTTWDGFIVGKGMA